MRPTPVAVLAVVETVVYGLVARHAYDDAHAVAVPLTLGFLFLVPAAAGYRSVATSEERCVGLLTPSAALLMMLAAGVALGGPGVLCVLILMPLFMLMALVGGALAALVRAIPRTAANLRAEIAQGAAFQRRGGGASTPQLLSPSAEADRVGPATRAPEDWRQIIIRIPF